MACQPGLFACYRAAALGVGVSGERAGQPALRLLAGEGQAATRNDARMSGEPVAEALGVNVYAKQRVDGRDRPQLERYFGVLSSHSSHRHRVVPWRAEPERFAASPAAGDQLGLPFGDSGNDDAVRATRRSRWGWLLRHVFRADVETCARCGGPMRWVEAATQKDAIGRLMAKHGLGPRPPPPEPFTPLGQVRLPFA